MKYKVSTTKRFDKALKKCIKRGLDMSKLKTIILILEESGCLPAIYRPHKLVGKYVGLWECHISPDWLLIWDQNDEELTLLFIDTGSHSDVFG